MSLQVYVMVTVSQRGLMEVVVYLEAVLLSWCGGLQQEGEAGEEDVVVLGG